MLNYKKFSFRGKNMSDWLPFATCKIEENLQTNFVQNPCVQVHKYLFYNNRLVHKYKSATTSGKDVFFVNEFNDKAQSTLRAKDIVNFLYKEQGWKPEHIIDYLTQFKIFEPSFTQDVKKCLKKLFVKECKKFGNAKEAKTVLYYKFKNMNNNVDKANADLLKHNKALEQKHAQVKNNNFNLGENQMGK